MKIEKMGPRSNSIMLQEGVIIEAVNKYISESNVDLTKKLMIEKLDLQQNILDSKKKKMEKVVIGAQQAISNVIEKSEKLKRSCDKKLLDLRKNL